MRTETGNKLNTAQRVGQLFRDIVDSFFHLSEGEISDNNIRITDTTLRTITAAVRVDLLSAPGADIIRWPMAVLVKEITGYNRDVFLTWESETDAIGVINITSGSGDWRAYNLMGYPFSANKKLQLAAAGTVTTGSADLDMVILYKDLDISAFTSI